MHDTTKPGPDDGPPEPSLETSEREARPYPGPAAGPPAGQQEPSLLEELLACLGDDAAQLRRVNPNDEVAETLERAALLLQAHTGKRMSLDPPLEIALQLAQAEEAIAMAAGQCEKVPAFAGLVAALWQAQQDLRDSFNETLEQTCARNLLALPWPSYANDSTALNWMEAQADLRLKEWHRAPGAERFFEIEDGDGEVIGTGPDLRAAIADAMGALR